MKKKLVTLILGIVMMGSLSSVDVLAKNGGQEPKSAVKVTMEEKEVVSKETGTFNKLRDKATEYINSEQYTSGEEKSEKAQLNRSLNGWVQSGSYWYYYSNGRKYQNQWLQSYGDWYYLDSNGVMATGEKYIKGNYYYFATNGVMKTGWQKRNNKWYYYSSSGAAHRGWIKSGNDWYCTNYNGEAVVGKWEIDGKIYYFDNNAIMKTGWVKIDGVWHYYQNSGEAREGWVKSGRDWYYINYDGSACTNGLYLINSNKYLFDSNGIMCTGWYLDLKGNIYYFYERGNNIGAMATGTVYIDGIRFTFNSNGVLIV